MKKRKESGFTMFDAVIYRIVYSMLYVFSLLPFPVLYALSNVFAFGVGTIFGYRKQVIADNIANAFPEKSASERKKIQQDFYKLLTDSVVETLKMLSISKRNLRKRVTINSEVINNLLQQQKPVQLFAAHQFNWEYGSLIAGITMNAPWVALYLPQANAVIDRLLLKMRSRFGAVMLSAAEFTSKMPQIQKQQHILAHLADQNPTFPQKSYWLHFFAQPAPFLISPEKGAVKQKAAVVFSNSKRIKRGYYQYELSLVTEDASTTATGELTRQYRTFLENKIKEDPANYLWSHRRWKHKLEPHFMRRWIDEEQPNKNEE